MRINRRIVLIFLNNFKHIRNIRNCFNISINTPPAKLDKLPCSARPTVSPAEPAIAITDVVAIPKRERIITIKKKYPMHLTSASINCFTPLSASFLSSHFRTSFRKSLINFTPMAYTTQAITT